MPKTILQLATEKLGTDFTDDKKVNDDVSCSFAVTTILNEADPNFPIITGTAQLDSYLTKHWERIYEPEAGCVVVSPTGEGDNPDMPNGHCGIYLNNTDIASNSSATGLWTQNYTRESWRERYYYKGKYPVRLFRKVVV